MLHTTFSLLRRSGACETGYRKLAKSLGGVNRYGRDTPIPLSAVIDSNGLDDALWCLRAAIEQSEGLSRDFTCDCADSVALLLTDERSLTAIAVSRRHARGQATDNDLSAARAATSAAEWAATSAAASAAEWAATWVAARAAASAAARDAARAAEWAAASAAARDAARAATSAAASAAAWVAARAAAWVAARDAARDALADRFSARIAAHDPVDNPLGEVPEQMPCLVNIGGTPCAA